MTTKHDQLLAFYEGLLASLNMEVETNGELSYAPPGLVDAKGKPTKIAAIVDGKRWIMPTKAVLSTSPWDDHIAFHPLSESFQNGDSATFNKLKGLVNIKLNATLAALLERLTEFAADTDKHGSVSAKAAKFLKLVPGIKPSSAQRMADIVARAEMDSAQRRLINVFLKRRAKLEGRIFVRGAMVNFPLREELNNAEPKAFGVTLSKKDQTSFQALFDYLLPDNDQLETYSVGMDLHTAPSFTVLLLAYVKVAERLNEMLHIHRKLFADVESLMIPLEWAEGIPNDFERLAAAIPPLPGNTGEPIKSSAVMEAQEVAAPVKRRASQLFDEKLKPVEKREESGRRDMVSADQSTTRATSTKLSFAERVRQQQTSTPSRFHTQPAPSTSSSMFDRSLSGRSYAGTKEEDLPPWAENPTGSRTIAGIDPKQQAELERQRQVSHRHGFPVTGVGRSSFSDRIARQTGGQGGMGLGLSDGSRFRL